jgi:putative nucleotidyltransferase with HDIG domain
MKMIDAAPQRTVVHAPLARVFEAASGVEYQGAPGSGREVRVISREQRRTIAAFSLQQAQSQSTLVKEVVGIPPDRVMYRHLAGPYVGATEVLHLRMVEEGTEALLRARFGAEEESAARLVGLSLEHAAAEHLQDLKAAVEGRAHPAAAEGVGKPDERSVPLPVMTSEQQLLAAVDRQEEAEWGHVGHGRGVARVAVSLAESVVLPQRQVEILISAALLHDVGKIALDNALWGTRGILSDQDRARMQAHSRLGADMAAQASLAEGVQSSILHHHERWDGAGYPDGLSGENIPLRARILAIAENVDTMLRASYRRETLSMTRILASLEEDGGQRWDPMLAREAVRIIRGR